jgi:hypothetical protein
LGRDEATILPSAGEGRYGLRTTLNAVSYAEQTEFEDGQSQTFNKRSKPMKRGARRGESEDGGGASSEHSLESRRKSGQVRTSADEVCQAIEEVRAEHPEYTAVQITKQLQEALPQERMLYEQVNAYLRSIGFGKQATRAPRTPEESTRVEQSIRVRTHSMKSSEERAKLELSIELKRDPKIQGNPAAAIV